MQGKPDSLIAYNTLNQKIISKGFCTLCGACEVLCPTSAISIENDTTQRLYDCSQELDLCPLCYETCPHSEALQLRAQKSVSDAPIKSEALGYYRKVVLAQATDPKLRTLGHGGGVVTSLLMYGVESQRFDSAVVSKSEPENPVKPEPTVATVPDDVLSAVGSKFFPSPILKAYGEAIYGYGKTKIAFVGVPCHVLAVRKIEAWRHKFGGNLAIAIGLFCFGTFSAAPLLKYLEDTYHVKSSEILHMRLSSKFVVQTEKETIRIPLPELMEHVMPSCRTCTDFTAELADLSVGSAYPLEGWSVVIIRTKAGEDLFYDAVEHGKINTWIIEKEPEVYERVARATMQKRAGAIQEAKKLKEKIGYLPVLMLHESPALANVKVEQIMTRDIKTISANATVTELLELMALQHHIGYPVIDEQGRPVGVVTLEEASFVDKTARDTTKVSEIMRKKVVTVFPGETALDAYRKMSEFESGRVFVMDPENPTKMLGIVTKSDLMQTLIDQS
jgi:coenzyme F420 hydrogenase subunit beta